jgi:hypothetical protein
MMLTSFYALLPLRFKSLPKIIDSTHNSSKVVLEHPFG